MEVAATMTSKGQVTVPKAIREALGLQAGDSVVFRIEGDSASLVRTPDFLSLAGSVAVPDGKRGAQWPEIIESARAARASERHI